MLDGRKQRSKTNTVLKPWDQSPDSGNSYGVTEERPLSDMLVATCTDDSCLPQFGSVIG